jgi:polyvinyl alcohol dehydrogenase (cytochrome)
MRFARLPVVLVPCLLPWPVLALVAGGGPAREDCQLQLDTPAPNYPFSVPGKARQPKQLRCFDGDAGCDLDGEVNGECHVPLDACFAAGELGACAPSTVTAFAVGGAKGDADLRALQQAGRALLPASRAACTTGQSVRVRLKRGKRGTMKAATRTVRLKARTASGGDADRVTLTCLPHEWPSYGYDHRNRRATPVERTLSSSNAGQLRIRWFFDISAYEGGSGGAVTSTPTVRDGMVYVTSWNGKVYALRARDGKVRWTYDTAAGGFGIQSSATLTPEGRLLLGDSSGTVHCLEAKHGRLLWKATVADTDPERSHIWGSPVVANGRVFVGRASHSDVPCTRGHLYAFDLETGAELWRYATIPERVCRNDTRVECRTNDDCGGAECIPGVSGGVTATVAVDPNGKTVYMASVGCFTSPSLGNSDSMFSLDAATGAAHWVHRTEFIEQFSDGPPYNDFGFLNGPLLVDAPDGAGGRRRLLLGPSKDGSVYAVDPATGASVWTRSLVPDPDFGGFGIFNGAPAWANDTLYATVDGATFRPRWPAGADHLFAFSGIDGATRWSANIGASWSPVAVANGLVFAGANDIDEYYVYDAASGARLNTIRMPGVIASGASIVDGVVYVGYWQGANGAGGVVALDVP